MTTRNPPAPGLPGPGSAAHDSRFAVDPHLLVRTLARALGILDRLDTSEHVAQRRLRLHPLLLFLLVAAEQRLRLILVCTNAS